MPSRHNSIAGTYFVTSRTWESRALFVMESFCSVFVEALLHYRGNGAYMLNDFVLMPDHFHVLLTPADDKTLERVVRYIKGGSARQLALAKAMRLPVWQRGFSDHRIRDLADFETHQRYIWQNPVRKKLVLETREFRWSSASGGHAMDEAPQGQSQKERATMRHGFSRALTVGKIRIRRESAAVWLGYSSCADPAPQVLKPQSQRESITMRHG